MFQLPTIGKISISGTGNSTTTVPVHISTCLYCDADKKAAYQKEQYDRLVPRLIHEKYSHDDEDSMINKGIADSSDADYVAYRAFVADCKTAAHKQIYGE